MRFGAHISAAGGVYNAPANSAKIGGEVFQFFSRPPQGGAAPKLTPEIIQQFKTSCQKFKQTASYLHAPYFINFASANPRIKHGSISVIREELERGTVLGAKYLMTHLGSAKELGEKDALTQTAEGLIKVLTGYAGTCELLLENSAGSGAIIGDDFAELGAALIKTIIKKLPKTKIGICLDTCHAFASGYDLRTSAAVTKTLAEFDQKIGLKYLKLIHLNDSLTEFDSRRDRHADLGDGQIGLEGITAIIKNPKLQKFSFILETPTDEKRKRDLNLLKKLRG